jgi:hypothetical protein
VRALLSATWQCADYSTTWAGRQGGASVGSRPRCRDGARNRPSRNTETVIAVSTPLPTPTRTATIVDRISRPYRYLPTWIYIESSRSAGRHVPGVLPAQGRSVVSDCRRSRSVRAHWLCPGGGGRGLGSPLTGVHPSDSKGRFVHHERWARLTTAGRPARGGLGGGVSVAATGRADLPPDDTGWGPILVASQSRVAAETAIAAVKRQPAAGRVTRQGEGRCEGMARCSV